MCIYIYTYIHIYSIICAPKPHSDVLRPITWSLVLQLPLELVELSGFGMLLLSTLLQVTYSAVITALGRAQQWQRVPHSGPEQQ